VHDEGAYIWHDVFGSRQKVHDEGAYVCHDDIERAQTSFAASHHGQDRDKEEATVYVRHFAIRPLYTSTQGLKHGTWLCLRHVCPNKYTPHVSTKFCFQRNSLY
jgi:hypothetical protein